MHKAKGGVTTILVSFDLCFAGVNSHPHIDCDLTPGFILQILLRFYCSFERVSSFMEGSTEGITDYLKYKSVCYLNGFPQNGMMPRPQVLPEVGMLPRELCTAFDVSK